MFRQKYATVGNSYTYKKLTLLKKFTFIYFSSFNDLSEVEKEVDFLLWTKENPNPSEYDKLKIGNLSALNSSHFKPDLPTKILIHGFEDHGTTGWVLKMTEQYFKKVQLIDHT